MYTWYYLSWSQCGRTWFSGCASQRYLTSLRKVLQTKLEILLSRIYWDSVRSRQDITSRMVKWKKYLWSTNRSFHIECVVRRNMVTKQSVKLAAEFFSARKVHMKREITQPSTDYLVCQLRSQLSRHTKQFRLKTRSHPEYIPDLLMTTFVMDDLGVSESIWIAMSTNELCLSNHGFSYKTSVVHLPW